MYAHDCIWLEGLVPHLLPGPRDAPVAAWHVEWCVIELEADIERNVGEIMGIKGCHLFPAGDGLQPSIAMLECPKCRCQCGVLLQQLEHCSIWVQDGRRGVIMEIAKMQGSVPIEFTLDNLSMAGHGGVHLINPQLLHCISLRLDPLTQWHQHRL